ncbi:ATP-binding protein [Streptomyces abikoensis]|uniref:ATP-binding protein n=1 Tax=Streptomyces abikoensis TaxID=97398 RepID=UPI0033FAB71B
MNVDSSPLEATSDPHPPLSTRAALTPIPFTDPWQYDLTVPRDPRGPGIVRVTLRAILGAHGLGELVDAATLLTSELATNSVRYAKGPATVCLRWTHPVLRVSVSDASPKFPVHVSFPMPTADANRGRGLRIVKLVADGWGGCLLGDLLVAPTGKTIWFELSLRAAPPPGGSGATVLVA